MTLNGLHIRDFEARIGKGHLCRGTGAAAIKPGLTREKP